MDDNNDPTPWLTLSLCGAGAAELFHSLRHNLRGSSPIAAALTKPPPRQRSGGAAQLDADSEPARLRQQLQQLLEGSLAAEPTALSAKARQTLKSLCSDPTARRVGAALAWRDGDASRHLLGFDHPAYPALLRALGDAPPLLYVRGSLDALSGPAVAIIGSRKASRQALDFAEDTAFTLARAGIVIVSGLARGVDAAAHRGALEAGGLTVAVAATGPDGLYPRQHRALEQRLLDNNGAVITEFPLQATLQRWCFPRRNRLISGLCPGVVVAEAALPSGSLTTASHALSQGREVMAVPGSVLNPGARGCHQLIRDGAELVENASQVLEHLRGELLSRLEDNAGPHTPVPHAAPPPASATATSADNPLQQTLLDCLATAATGIDALVEQCHEPAHRVLSALGTLELQGMVARQPGGRYVRCKSVDERRQDRQRSLL